MLIFLLQVIEKKTFNIRNFISSFSVSFLKQNTGKFKAETRLTCSHSFNGIRTEVAVELQL